MLVEDDSACQLYLTVDNSGSLNRPARAIEFQRLKGLSLDLQIHQPGLDPSVVTVEFPPLKSYDAAYQIFSLASPCSTEVWIEALAARCEIEHGFYDAERNHSKRIAVYDPCVPGLPRRLDIMGKVTEANSIPWSMIGQPLEGGLSWSEGAAFTTLVENRGACATRSYFYFRPGNPESGNQPRNIDIFQIFSTSKFTPDYSYKTVTGFFSIIPGEVRSSGTSTIWEDCRDYLYQVPNDSFCAIDGDYDATGGSLGNYVDVDPCLTTLPERVDYLGFQNERTVLPLGPR